MNLLHAQKPNAIGEDSLSLYKEMYSKFLASGDRERALYYGDKFVAEWIKEALPKDSLYISYVERLAILHYNSGDVVKAKQILEELLPIKKAFYGEESPDFAVLLSNLAVIHSDLGNNQEAIRLGTEALEIRKKVLGPEHPRYAKSLSNLANYYYKLGNYQEAIRLVTEALEIQRFGTAGRRS